jgi:hypothetical protein
MLSEIMENMQMQQSQSKPGSGSCKKPGGTGSGKPSNKKGKQLKDLSQMSKEMKEALEKMLGQQEGKKPGDKPGDKPGQKPGDKPGGNQPNGPGQGGSGSSQKEGKDGKASDKEGISSKEFAQLAAKQAALRKALQQLNNEQNKSGGKPFGNLDQLVKDMEKNETELVNKHLTNEMLRRQKEIETRLLEAENAERKQDQDNQRESKTANDPPAATPAAILEYLKKKQTAVDLYKTVPPNLQPYYKKLVEDYFKNMRLQ